MSGAQGEAAGKNLAVSHPWRVKWASKVLAVPGLAMLALAPLGWLVDLPNAAWALLSMVPALLALACTAPALITVLATRSSFGPDRIRLDGGVLSYGEHTQLAMDEVAMVWLRDDERVQVRTVDGRTLTIKLGREHARALAAALQRGRRGKAAYTLQVDDAGLRLMKEYAWWTVPAALATPFIAASPLLAAPAAAAAIASAVFGLRRHPELTFGADGVRLRTRWRRKGRFVAYSDIEAVDLQRRMLMRRLILTLRGGETVEISVASDARARLVQALLREGVGMHETGLRAGARVAALEGGEDVDDWQRRAKRALVKGADYRVAAIEPDQLEWLMRNPAASATQRVGAALAMREAAEGRRQIRVAANVTSDPVVREALELLGSEEDELDAPSLEAALARVRAQP